MKYFLFFLGLALISFTNTGHACSCNRATTSEKLAHADYVFSATVESITPAAQIHVSEQMFVQLLKVNHIWKGDLAEEFTVLTSGSGGMCGYPFEEGVNYLVYANRSEEGVITGLCHGTREMEYAYLDRTELGSPLHSYVQIALEPITLEYLMSVVDLEKYQNKFRIDPDQSIKSRAATEVLSRYKPYSQIAIMWALEKYHNGYAEIHREAVNSILLEHAKDHPELTPILLEIYESQRWNTKGWVLMSLPIPEAKDEYLSRLISLLRSANQKENYIASSLIKQLCPYLSKNEATELLEVMVQQMPSLGNGEARTLIAMKNFVNDLEVVRDTLSITANAQLPCCIAEAAAEILSDFENKMRQRKDYFDQNGTELNTPEDCSVYADSD